MHPIYHNFLIKINILWICKLGILADHDCCTVKRVFADFTLECCFYSQMKSHPCILLILRLRGDGSY